MAGPGCGLGAGREVGVGRIGEGGRGRRIGLEGTGESWLGWVGKERGTVGYGEPGGKGRNGIAVGGREIVGLEDDRLCGVVVLSRCPDECLCLP